MKKNLFKIIMGLIFFSIFTYGCKKEIERPGPNVTLMSDTAGFVWSDTAMASGDTAIIGLQCKWNENDLITKIRTSLNEVLIGESDVAAINGQELTVKTKITRSLAVFERWKFEVIDAKNHITEINLVLSIDSGGAISPPINVTLGAQKNTEIGSYYDITNDRVHKKDIAEANPGLIDLIGGYDYDYFTFIASPISDNFFGVYDLSGWATRNETLFCATTLKPEQYNLITKDNLLVSSFHEDEAVALIYNLKVNDIYSFRTQAGKYGLLKIMHVAIAEENYIAFEYKIQL